MPDGLKLTYDESSQSGKWSCGTNVILETLTYISHSDCARAFCAAVWKTGCGQQRWVDLSNRTSHVCFDVRPPKKRWHFTFENCTLTHLSAGVTELMKKKTSKATKSNTLTSHVRGNKKENCGGLLFGKSRHIVLTLERMIITLCNIYNACSSNTRTSSWPGHI